MPFFCFYVSSVTEDKDKQLTTIKILEIPHQDLLLKRTISLTKVIWLDGNQESDQNQKYKQQLTEQFRKFDIEYATDIT